MRLRFLLSVFSAVIGLAVLSGCANGFLGMASRTYETPGEARLFLSPSQCPHLEAKPEAAPLVAATLTAIGGELLSRFGVALTQGAEGGDLRPSIAIHNFQPERGSIPRCIIVVRGEFSDSQGAQDIATILPEVPEVEKSMRLPGSDDAERTCRAGPESCLARDDERLKALHIPKLVRLDHYIELTFRSSSNEQALSFAPVFVFLKQSIDGKTSGTRDLSVELKFQRVQIPPQPLQQWGSVVLIPAMEIGSYRRYKPLPLPVDVAETDPHPRHAFPRESPWFISYLPPASQQEQAPKPAGTDRGAASESDSAARAQATTQPTGSQPASSDNDAVDSKVELGEDRVASSSGALQDPRPVLYSSKKHTSMPVTLTATVVETRPTNEGLAFVATVFGVMKPQLQTELKAAIDPAHAAAAETAEVNAHTKYMTSYKSAAEAMFSYCNHPADNTPDDRKKRFTLSVDARSKQITADHDAVSASQQRPFHPFLVSIGVEPVDRINKEACEAWK